MTDPVQCRVLHLAVDYNTPYRKPTTRAVEWFVEELADVDNVIIALRRSVRPWAGTARQCPSQAGLLFDMRYFGLPWGLGLHGAMKRAASRIIALLIERGIRPNLVHAHKMTFEGLAGWYVARHFDIPLFLSIRGEVETKVFRYKPGLRKRLREMAAYASKLYFVSAWFEEEFRRHVPGHEAKKRRLPNIVHNISPFIEKCEPGDRFVAVLNLDTRKRKRLNWLLDGLAIAAKTEPRMRLDIIGGGTTKSLTAALRMIDARGLTDIVRLIGPLSNETLLNRLKSYRALVLPSVNETFGMVYVEALFAGIPILYTAGTGIDGYVNALDVGIAVPSGDVHAISDALLSLWRNSMVVRANIAAHAADLFALFDPKTTIDAYRSDLRAACAMKESCNRTDAAG
jgi:glycosyltransferase involved in cell wall biosynthesis